MRTVEPKESALAGGAPVVRASGHEAISAALRNLAASGEAVRIGIIGTTGTGKTTLTRAVILAYLRVSPGLVVVTDAKAERRFDDLLPPELVAVRGSISELAPGVNPLPPGVRMLILRPNVFEGEEIDTEEVARYLWRLAGRRTASLNVNDEFIPHAAQFGFYAGGKSSTLRKSFTQGRVHLQSELWGAHDLIDVPISTISHSRLLCFHLTGEGLKVLRTRNYLIGIPDGLLESLPDDEAPPDQRGWFVQLRNGKPWDGKLYRV